MERSRWNQALSALAGTVIVAALAALAQADVTSGPVAGEAPPSALKTHLVVGEPAGKEVDLVAHRDKKPTLIALVPTERWGRPTARFLKALDTGLKEVEEGRLCAVWLTADHAAAREYLPKAQMSLQFERTDLGDYTGEAGGPPEWGINGEADITVVALRDGKVVKTWGFVSVNDTVAREVLQAVQKPAAK